MENELKPKLDEPLVCPKCSNNLFKIRIHGVSSDGMLEVIAYCSNCFEPITTKYREELGI